MLDSRGEHRLAAGIAVFIAPDEIHQFRNTGSGPLRFLCLIPHPLRGMNEPCCRGLRLWLKCTGRPSCL